MDSFLLSIFGSPGTSDQQVETETVLSADSLRLLLEHSDPKMLIDQKGNTILQKLSQYTQELPTHVYILAQHGCLINQRNIDGETALHSAVRAGNRLIAEALLHCGADVTITNKIGTSALDLCSGDMNKLVMRFHPPLQQAVCTGDFTSVCKLLKNWVSVTSKCLSDGQSMADLTKTKLTEDVYVLKCLQKIRDHNNQSRLIHAVLSDDVRTAKSILEGTKIRTVNCRYKKETSLLSVAIENKNCEMVELLLVDGVRTNGKVRHRLSQPNDSVPCVLLAYSNQPDLRVAQLMWQYSIHALHERDKEGNTSLISAVTHGASLSFIQWYVHQTEGRILAKRNIEKLTALEVARRLGRQDITDFLEQYVTDHIHKLDSQLLAQSYGHLHPMLADRSHQVAEVIGLLLKASETGEVDTVIKYNTMNYQDANGHTALHKAVACSRAHVIRELAHSRPALKSLSDNHGRYPLHIAFLLPPDSVRQEILSVLLQSNAESYEFVSDKDGLSPADYSILPEETRLSILREITAS